MSPIHTYTTIVISLTCKLADYHYEVIPTRKGKSLLMWRGYTYAQNYGLAYYCSQYSRTKCKARLKLDKSGNIESADGEHMHPPPKYIKSKNGQYIKI